MALAQGFQAVPGEDSLMLWFKGCHSNPFMDHLDPREVYLYLLKHDRLLCEESPNQASQGSCCILDGPFTPFNE